MEDNVASVIKKLEASGKVEAKKSLESLKESKDVSAEMKKLETFFKSAEETFKKETGREMSYAEMRGMMG